MFIKISINKMKGNKKKIFQLLKFFTSLSQIVYGLLPQPFLDNPYIYFFLSLLFCLNGALVNEKEKYRALHAKLQIYFYRCWENEAVSFNNLLFVMLVCMCCRVMYCDVERKSEKIKIKQFFYWCNTNLAIFLKSLYKNATILFII